MPSTEGARLHKAKKDSQTPRCTPSITNNGSAPEYYEQRECPQYYEQQECSRKTGNAPGIGKTGDARGIGKTGNTGSGPGVRRDGPQGSVALNTVVTETERRSRGMEFAKWQRRKVAVFGSGALFPYGERVSLGHLCGP